MFGKTAIVRFEGTVHLRQCASLINQEEFQGKFVVTKEFLCLENSDLVIPQDNIAFYRGKFTIDYK